MCNDKLLQQWKRIVLLFVSQGQNKVTFIACSCMNGPRLPEAAPGRESCAGAQVKSHMAYSSCALDILSLKCRDSST